VRFWQVSLIPIAPFGGFSGFTPQTIENAYRRNVFFGGARAFTGSKGPFAGAAGEKK
jgi:hypothetical protein